MCTEKPYFPMFVDLSGKRIVVVGGGKIAERRIDTLLEFADNITIISPKVTEGIKRKAKEQKVRWIPKAFCDDKERCGAEDEKLFGDTKSLLERADMVIAATSDITCNEEIRRICRERGILVNVSHKKELCDFYFPAVVVRDNVSVGISSGGMNPVQARKIRERVEAVL